MIDNLRSTEFGGECQKEMNIAIKRMHSLDTPNTHAFTTYPNASALAQIIPHLHYVHIAHTMARNNLHT